MPQVRIRAETGNEISSKVSSGVEDLLLRVEAASDPVGHAQIGKLVVQVDNLLQVKVHAGVPAGLICRKVRRRLRGVDTKRSTAPGRNEPENRHLQALLRPARQRREEPVQPPRLRSALRQKAAIEHADDRLLRVLPQAENGQVEPDPPERFLEVAMERLLMKRAEASQVRKVDSAPQRKHRFE
jgi:hypothetical protein